MSPNQKSSGFYINYWAGEKGGVGKSWCARLDAQRHVDRDIDFWLMDADRGNRSTLKFYPEFAFEQEVFFTEVPELRSKANPFFEAALERPVVANCQAGKGREFWDWLREKNVIQSSREYSVQLRYFFVSDLGRDSINSFAKVARAFAPMMSLVFVANRGCNFMGMQFFEAPEFQAVLEEYKIPVVNLPQFDLNWRRFVEGDNPDGRLVNWGEARQVEEFGVLGRAEIQTYLENFYGQVDDAERLADLEFSKRIL
ncbi:MAG: hypothetical protein AAGB01_10745 [Cyanobacteria bacterium P01_F01_bin.42]